MGSLSHALRNYLKNPAAKTLSRVAATPSARKGALEVLRSSGLSGSVVKLETTLGKRGVSIAKSAVDFRRGYAHAA